MAYMRNVHRTSCGFLCFADHFSEQRKTENGNGKKKRNVCAQAGNYFLGKVSSQNIGHLHHMHQFEFVL